MGAVESCCGKRRPADMPSMPTKPVSALGNQYVTFNPEQPEVFIMRQRIWTSHQPFDVKDIALNDWFKIEGKDAQVMARHPHWPLSRVSPFSNGPCCHRARRERRSALSCWRWPCAFRSSDERDRRGICLLSRPWWFVADGAWVRCSGPARRSWF